MYRGDMLAWCLNRCVCKYSFVNNISLKDTQLLSVFYPELYPVKYEKTRALIELCNYSNVLRHWA